MARFKRDHTFHPTVFRRHVVMSGHEALAHGLFCAVNDIRGEKEQRQVALEIKHTKEIRDLIMSAKSQATSTILREGRSTRPLHEVMRDLMKKYNVGLKKLSDEARLPVPRIREFLTAEDEPTPHEFRRLCHGLPGLGYAIEAPKEKDEAEPSTAEATNPAPSLEWDSRDNTLTDLATDMVAIQNNENATEAAVDATKVEGKKDETIRFGVALRAARKSESLSASELARLLDVSTGAVDFWEAGKTFPYKDNFQKLVDIFPSLASWSHLATKDRPTRYRAGEGAEIAKGSPIVGPTIPVEQGETKVIGIPAPVFNVQDTATESKPVSTPALVPSSAQPTREPIDHKRFVKFYKLAAVVSSRQSADFLELLRMASKLDLTVNDLIEALDDNEENDT